MPHIATVPTGSFVRKIAGTSFYVENSVPLEEDPYPPGRVTDLRVERVLDSASEIKLSWTAPGGDYDKGKGINYDYECAFYKAKCSFVGILMRVTILIF